MTPDHAAHLEIEIAQSSRRHDVIIDSGFSDYLYLPENEIAALNLQFVGSVPMKLADNSITIADLYEANMVWSGLVWFGDSILVTVTAGRTVAIRCWGCVCLKALGSSSIMPSVRCV